MRRVAAGIALSTVLVFAIEVSAKRRAPHARSGSGSVPFLANALAAVVVAYLTVAVLLVAWGLVQRRRSAGSQLRANRGGVVWTFVLLIVLLTLAARLHRTSDKAQVHAVAQTAAQRIRDVPPTLSKGLDLTWGIRLGFLIVVVGAVALLAASRRSKPEPRPVALPRDELLTVSLDELLSTLRAEPDPRRAVLLAYAGLEHALAQGGLARSETQTAQEFLGIVSRHLSLSQTALIDLTALCDLALFSVHTIDSPMRDRAIDGLVRVRNELGARSAPVSV